MEEISFHNVIPSVFKASGVSDTDIWGADITFKKGLRYLIKAASGRGKSTFCSYITGYRRDYTGIIRFDGNDISAFKTAQWNGVRKLHISLLYQELRLFTELTAFENVEIKNRLTRYQSADVIKSWFERLGIADKMNENVGRMSYGQQQRVALIRTLVQPSDFIILDEPISHIDDENAARMYELIDEELRKSGAGCVVTSIGKHFDADYTKTIRL